MAGPNLELFKMGLYLFCPLLAMIHYGDPDWYIKHVKPIRDEFWPQESRLFHPPRNSADLKETLSNMKEERLAKRAQRLGENATAMEDLKRKRASEAQVAKQSAQVHSTASAVSSEAALAQRKSIVEQWTRIDRARQV